MHRDEPIPRRSRRPAPRWGAECDDPIPALKQQLAKALGELIEPVRQGVAAGVLGIEQPRISDIARGRLERLSLQRLIRLLTRGGRTVTIAVRVDGPDHYVLPTGPALARQRLLNAARGREPPREPPPESPRAPPPESPRDPLR